MERLQTMGEGQGGGHGRVAPHRWWTKELKKTRKRGIISVEEG